MAQWLSNISQAVSDGLEKLDTSLNREDEKAAEDATQPDTSAPRAESASPENTPVKRAGGDETDKLQTVIREKEEINRSQKLQLQETNEKLAKVKLQAKAKILSLTKQLNEAKTAAPAPPPPEASLPASNGESTSNTSSSASPTESASSQVEALKTRCAQLEETLSEKEQLLKSRTEAVELLRDSLTGKDQMIADLESSAGSWKVKAEELDKSLQMKGSDQDAEAAMEQKAVEIGSLKEIIRNFQATNVELEAKLADREKLLTSEKEKLEITSKEFVNIQATFASSSAEWQNAVKETRRQAEEQLHTLQIAVSERDAAITAWQTRAHENETASQHAAQINTRLEAELVSLRQQASAASQTKAATDGQLSQPAVGGNEQTAPSLGGGGDKVAELKKTLQEERAKMVKMKTAALARMKALQETIATMEKEKGEKDGELAQVREVFGKEKEDLETKLTQSEERSDRAQFEVGQLTAQLTHAGDSSALVESLKADVASLRESGTMVREQASILLQEKAGMVEAYEARISEALSGKDSLAAELRSIQEYAIPLQEELKLLKIQREETMAETERLRSELSDAAGNASTANSLSELVNDKSSLESTVVELTNQKSHMETSLGELTVQKSQVETTLGGLTNQKSQMETSLEELTNQKSQMETSLGELTNQKSQMETSLGELTNQKSQMETSLGELSNNRTELEATLLELTNRKTESENAARDATNRVAQLEASLSELSEKNAEAEDSLRALSQHKVDYDNRLEEAASGKSPSDSSEQEAAVSDLTNSIVDLQRKHDEAALQLTNQKAEQQRVLDESSKVQTDLEASISALVEDLAAREKQQVDAAETERQQQAVVEELADKRSLLQTELSEIVASVQNEKEALAGLLDKNGELAKSVEDLANRKLTLEEDETNRRVALEVELSSRKKALEVELSNRKESLEDELSNRKEALEEDLSRLVHQKTSMEEALSGNTEPPKTSTITALGESPTHVKEEQPKVASLLANLAEVEDQLEHVQGEKDEALTLVSELEATNEEAIRNLRANETSKQEVLHKLEEREADMAAMNKTLAERDAMQKKLIVAVKKLKAETKSLREAAAEANKSASAEAALSTSHTAEASLTDTSEPSADRDSADVSPRLVESPIVPEVSSVVEAGPSTGALSPELVELGSKLSALKIELSESEASNRQLELVCKELTSRKRELESETQKLETEREQLTLDFDKQLDEQLELVSSKAVQLVDAQRMLEVAQQAEHQTKQSLDEARTELEQVKSINHQSQSSVDQLTRALGEELAKSVEWADRCRAVEVAIRSYEQQCVDLTEQVRKVEEEKMEAVSRVDALSEKLRVAHTSREAAEAEMSVIKEELAVVEADREDAKKQMMETSEKLNECKLRYIESRSNNDVMEQELTTVREKLVTAEVQMGVMEGKVEELTQACQQMKVIEEQLVTVTDENLQKSASEASVERRAGNLEKERASLQSHVEQLQTQLQQAKAGFDEERSASVAQLQQLDMSHKNALEQVSSLELEKVSVEKKVKEMASEKIMWQDKILSERSALDKERLGWEQERSAHEQGRHAWETDKKEWEHERSSWMASTADLEYKLNTKQSTWNEEKEVFESELARFKERYSSLEQQYAMVEADGVRHATVAQEAAEARRSIIAERDELMEKLNNLEDLADAEAVKAQRKTDEMIREKELAGAAVEEMERDRNEAKSAASRFQGLVQELQAKQSVYDTERSELTDQFTEMEQERDRLEQERVGLEIRCEELEKKDNEGAGAFQGEIEAERKRSESLVATLQEEREEKSRLLRRHDEADGLYSANLSSLEAELQALERKRREEVGVLADKYQSLMVTEREEAAKIKMEADGLVARIAAHWKGGSDPSFTPTRSSGLSEAVESLLTEVVDLRQEVVSTDRRAVAQENVLRESTQGAGVEHAQTECKRLEEELRRGKEELEEALQSVHQRDYKYQQAAGQVVKLKDENQKVKAELDHTNRRLQQVSAAARPENTGAAGVTSHKTSRSSPSHRDVSLENDGVSGESSAALAESNNLLTKRFTEVSETCRVLKQQKVELEGECSKLRAYNMSVEAAKEDLEERLSSLNSSTAPGDSSIFIGEEEGSAFTLTSPSKRDAYSLVPSMARTVRQLMTDFPHSTTRRRKLFLLIGYSILIHFLLAGACFGHWFC